MHELADIDNDDASSFVAADLSPDVYQQAEALLARRGSPESRSQRGQLYDWQKITGDRTSTGAMKLEKLKPKHKQVISLHLQGISNNDIARVTGYDAAWVCTLLADPLVQPYLDKFSEMTDREITVLQTRAVEVVREGMESSNEKTRLAAADKVFKANGTYGDKKDQGASASEVIANALASMATLAENVAIRSVTASSRENMREINPKEINHETS